jgi:hypothetical protein
MGGIITVAAMEIQPLIQKHDVEMWIIMQIGQCTIDLLGVRYGQYVI